MFGRDVDERARGEEFLEWLRDEARQRLDNGAGAFARWVVAAVEDGELRPQDTWYPGAMKARSVQFPEEDWRDAKSMYITREMRYCSGDGSDEDWVVETEDGTCVKLAESCWVGGSCSGLCTWAPGPA